MFPFFYLRIAKLFLIKKVQNFPFVFKIFETLRLFVKYKPISWSTDTIKNVAMPKSLMRRIGIFKLII